jgi:hypothetical protein
MVSMQELDICIRVYPNEATFHFFKGLWSESAAYSLNVASDVERSRLLAEAEKSLTTASQMEPSWEEPVNRLASMKSI